ncbi:hypothetical protein BC832DRAFT_546706 [Gaertneriomyces semiglobifer]|nr:hypothetical protein BC832DRAFT_546706 [Gaertneriomyces semiglobifer]
MPNTTNNLAQVLGLRRRVSESNEQTLLRILQGSTCSPMSLKDLQRYLENKTFCRENLDALQWFVSYRSRFNDLPPAEKALSPPPTDFDLTSGVSTHTTSPHNDSFFDSIPTARNLHKVIVDTQSDLSTAPVDAQPFRHEVNAAIKIFFTSGGDSELNIPGPMRMAIVEHAKHTTHPCVFAPAARHCFDIISSSSIPAFTKHAAENIQTVSRLERLGVAIILFLLGFIAAFCLVSSWILVRSLHI